MMITNHGGRATEDQALEWLGPNILEMRGELRTLTDRVVTAERDMDMLIRIMTRLDHTVTAVRADISTSGSASRA